MRILYFYQYFSTPKGSWGTRVYEFTKEWIARGHHVTVVTSVYSKSDIKAVKLIERQQIEGVELIVINVQIDNKQHPLKRIWTFLQYSFFACYFALRHPCDLVIASSGPITVGLPGLLSKWIRRKKLVFEVRDLWPDTAIEMGYIKSYWIKKMMYFFEKLCYKQSDLIVTLSPGSAKNIQNRYGDLPLISVPNSANIDLFQMDSDRSLPSQLRDVSYAIYTGNIGEVNNSTLLVETAKILKKKEINGLKIVLVGEGPQKKQLQEEQKKFKLSSHLLFLDQMPKDQLVLLIRESMASLIPLANRELLDTSSPNKLFESLAAGVPVIQTTGGWIRELLDQHQCGFTVHPEQPAELADLLIHLKKNPELAHQAGKNALATAKSCFDKVYLADKMLNRMSSLLS